MDVELMIPSERVAPIIVTFDDLAYGVETDRTVQIGQKQWGQPGSCTYKWLIEWMDPAEVRELIKALEFALHHMPKYEDKAV